MKHIASGMLLAFALAGTPALADEDVGVVESEQGTLKSVFYSVWSRLQALSPRTEEVRSGGGVIATAGLRGAGDENLELEPYWKNDLSEDAAFQQQIGAYRDAIERGREGNEQALRDFLDQYDDSDLAANVRFGLAVARARAGDRDTARSQLREFLERYPEHPMAADARTLLERLNG